MKSVSGKKFAKILEENDWKLIRIKGSHNIFEKAGLEATLLILIHSNKD